MTAVYVPQLFRFMNFKLAENMTTFRVHPWTEFGANFVATGEQHFSLTMNEGPQFVGAAKRRINKSVPRQRPL